MKNFKRSLVGKDWEYSFHDFGIVLIIRGKRVKAHSRRDVADAVYFFTSEDIYNKMGLCNKEE